MSYLSVLNKEDENLISMIRVLREFFGNRAVNADWQRQMETYERRGWSKSSFIRRLKILKKKGWVRVVSGGLKGDKTLEGAFYEATELAPGESVSHQRQIGVSDTGSNQSENRADPIVPPTMNELRSELAKAKQAAKELLKKGKPPHAA